MPYNHLLHHRRSIRLQGYDYAKAGLYFITLCVQDKAYLFGDISESGMVLNEAGKMVEQVWLDSPKRFSSVALHAHIVMPNHFHGIIQIKENVGATLVVAKGTVEPVKSQEQADDNSRTIGQPQGIAPTISSIISAFKSITTVEYIRGVKEKNWTAFKNRLWQRNYWEHIIIDEKEYHTISDYIQDNPLNWDTDKLK